MNDYEIKLHLLNSSNCKDLINLKKYVKTKVNPVTKEKYPISVTYGKKGCNIVHDFVNECFYINFSYNHWDEELLPHLITKLIKEGFPVDELELYNRNIQIIKSAQK